MSLAVVILLAIPATLRAVPTVGFEFEGCPCFVSGDPGDVKTFDVFVRVTTTAAESGEGASGWSFSVAASGGSVTDISMADFSVPTSDGSLLLATALFQTAQLATGPDEAAGAIGAVILTSGPPQWLLPDRSAIVARLRCEVTIPPSGECVPFQLDFRDGMRGRGQPVLNRASFAAQSISPATEPCTIPVCPAPLAVDCEIPLLKIDQPEVFALSEGAPERLYRLEDGVTGTVILTVTDEKASHANALYTRFGAPATAGTFDDFADENEPNPRLIVPLELSDPLFVLTRGSVTTGTHQITLLAQRAPALVLERISVDRAGRGGDGILNFTAVGDGFAEGMTFGLIRNGQTAATQGENSRIVTGRRADLEFDLSNVPAGVYDLEARLAGAEASLPAALTILETTVGPLFDIQLAGDPFYRFGRSQRLDLIIENPGDSMLDAPCLQIVAPEGTQLRLDRDEEFKGSVLDVLGTHVDGIPGRIPPFGRVTIPLIMQSETCDDCDLTLLARICASDAADLVRWDLQAPPPGMSAADWNTAWPRLSALMGATWPEFERSLREAAGRWALRGGNSASVSEIFAFLTQGALGRPNSAIVGRLTQASTQEPLAGQDVLALQTGSVRSSTTTDERGNFAIPCLRAGERYDVRVAGYDVGDISVEIPPDRDVTGLELLGTAAANGLIPASPDCDFSSLPLVRLPHPEELLAPIASYTTRVVSSWDPNEKEGSADGDLDPRELRPGQQLRYTVFFENMMDATAPAQMVLITDTLDPNLDPDTLALREIQYGGDNESKRISLDNTGSELSFGYRDGTASSSSQRRAFSEVENDVIVRFIDPLGNEQNLSLDVRIDVDVVTLSDGNRQVQWLLSTQTDSAIAGFLPPNDETRRGEGHVTFTVRPKADVAIGTEISNEADITFDNLEKITTNRVVHTVVVPTPSVPSFPVPASTLSTAITASTQLSWQGGGATERSLFLWPAGQERPAEPTVTGLGANLFEAAEALAEGTIYEWQVIATNEFGSIEGPVWTFLTLGDRPAPPLAPRDPNVPIGSTDVVRAPLLRWEGGEGAETFDVFVWPQLTIRPASALIRGVTQRRIQLIDLLASNTPYNWQVVAANRGGSAEGEVWTFTTGERTFVPFTRGDTNTDGFKDISDGIQAFNFLFLGGLAPKCGKAVDVNDDGTLDISDGIAFLNFLFLGAAPPPPPFAECGEDPTFDLLGCETFPCE